MNVVVNAVNCRKGGVVQVAVGFIENSLKIGDTNFIYIVSPEVYSRLTSIIDVNSRQFYIMKYRPWSIFHTIILNWRVYSLVKRNYTYSISIGFPSLLFCLRNEVGRWTDPWNIYPKTDLPYSGLSFWFKVKLKVLRPLKFILVKRAKLIFTESTYVAEHIKARLKNGVKVIVTPNFVNGHYLNRVPVQNFSSNVLYVLMADHPHKDFEILVESLRVLKDKGYVFKVVMSIDKLSRRGKELLLKAKKIGVENQLDLVGFVTIGQSEKYFKESFALVLPTHLEVFSITPLEAGSFGLPSVVSDYMFNRSVYNDTVLYFDPFSPYDLAMKIIQMKEDMTLYLSLARRSKAMSKISGEHIVKNFIGDLNVWQGE